MSEYLMAEATLNVGTPCIVFGKKLGDIIILHRVERQATGAKVSLDSLVSEEEDRLLEELYKIYEEL